MNETSTSNPLVTVRSSLIIDYDQSPDDFDKSYVLCVSSIIENLNKGGRNGERITWIQGEYIPGKDFPLDISWGLGTHYYIEGRCRIPRKKFNSSERV